MIIILLNDVMFFILHLIDLCVCVCMYCKYVLLSTVVFEVVFLIMTSVSSAVPIMLCCIPLIKSRPVHTSPIHSDLYIFLFLFSSPSISLALPFSLFTGKSCPNYCQHGHFGICTIREF